jgi:phosphate transport system ATP-binding protein
MTTSNDDTLGGRTVSTADQRPETLTTMTEHATDPSGDGAGLVADLSSLESAPPAAVADVANRIVVEHLNIYYGDFLAVEDVNMVIEPRSVTALIGPSGCGKSTFLRSLNRMHEVIAGARVSGTVLVDGIDLYGPRIDPVAVRRKVGMVFQRPNPFPTMSIYDNVLAGKKLNSKRLKKAEADGLVEGSLRAANLWEEVKDRLGRPGSSLSGGQQQRLCIARAIAIEPEVLLMDEPCSALDPISTLAIEQLMTELRETYTIVIVTHNMQQAARVSDRTAFFSIEGAGKPGKLVEMDATETIFSNPSRQATIDYVTGRFG